MHDADVASSDNEPELTIGKGDEFRTILFLVLIVVPVVVVGFIGAYGFIVWMLQMLVGLPTH